MLIRSDIKTLKQTSREIEWCNFENHQPINQLAIKGVKFQLSQKFENKF